MKSRNSVHSAIMTFFKMDNWEEAKARFGTWVNNEKLLRFTASQQYQQCCPLMMETTSAIFKTNSVQAITLWNLHPVVPRIMAT